MKKSMKKGFTLVELMVVVIIVGILAAVAVPLMSANKDKAMNSEAIAAAGAVSTAARLYMVETGDVPATTDDLEGSGLFNMADLDGTYYMEGDYEFTDFNADTGRVDGFTAGDWTFVWNSTINAYTSTKAP
jgi:prepilin-type N-terminal cleavage/methylation domain-containing protein